MTADRQSGRDDATRGPAADEALGQRVLRSEEILGGEREVLIVHRGELYRLRETRNGGLILGK